MPYNPNIPQATDQESQSQADLLANFTGLNNFLDVNHISINNVNQGKHKFIHFPLQTVVPAPGPTQFPPATLATEFGIYNAVNGAGTRALFLRKTNVAGVVTGDMDITTATQTGSKGWCYLPCGIVMKWGTLNMIAGATTTETYIVGPGAFTAIYNIQVSNIKAAAVNMDGAIARSYTTTQIILKNTSTTAVDAYYMIMGII